MGKLNGKRKYLGIFETIEEAENAVKKPRALGGGTDVSL